MVFQQLMSKERGVREASRLSGHATSSYYYKPKQRATKKRIDLAILEAIEREALEHPSYGVRRITAMLKRKGMHVNRKKVHRLMKIANLIKRRSVRKHAIRKRTLTVPVRSNHLWEQDITYIWCGNDGWCYLFNILDCYTREWLSYTFSKECGTDEAVRTFDRAILDRFPGGVIPEGLTVRNDGGPQYTSDRFIKILQACKINQEVTAKNSPEEDAYIEAFHKSLKEDYVWQHEFQTFQDADEMMKQFFIDYNWKRPHSSLKYMTPKEFYGMSGGNV
ncbi:MAG: IS3 family transposase [Nitrososphaerales archaeon]